MRYRVFVFLLGVLTGVALLGAAFLLVFVLVQAAPGSPGTLPVIGESL
jgi:hypothetical protein